MPTTIQALGVFALLLPGFACAYIVQQLTTRPKQTELDKVIEAFLFSLLLYLCVGPVFHFALPVGWHAAAIGAQDYQIQIAWREMAVLAAVAVGFSVLYAANINHDWIWKFMRWICVTERTARTSIWGDSFQDIGGCTVQVGLADGRTVKGWVRYYSDDVGEASVFLEEAEWVDAEGKKIPIRGPGILLAPKSDIQYVMFLDDRAENGHAGTELKSPIQ